jgi:hypothetical protein
MIIITSIERPLQTTMKADHFRLTQYALILLSNLIIFFSLLSTRLGVYQF